MELTQADKIALTRQDGYHFCYKGILADFRRDFEASIEYYRLGALLGDTDCFSNLAVSYDQGMGVPKNPSLALAYFQIAVQNGSLDAAAMLARKYRRGEYGEPDPDTAAYYLRWGETIGRRHPEKLELCIPFCEDLAKAKMPGGLLPTDLAGAYRLLKMAEAGYQRLFDKWGNYLQEEQEALEKLLNDPIFDEFRGRKREAPSEEVAEQAADNANLVGNDEDPAEYHDSWNWDSDFNWNFH